MKQQPTQVAVLFFCRGSNLKTLAEHMAQAHVPAELTLAVSNRPKAGGLGYCASQGIAHQAIDHTLFDSRESFDAALDAALRAAKIELVCCAGFMRLLSAGFVEAWRDRIINIHPSLLPKYKGLHTHARALEAGDKRHGCSVHYMRPEMDEGPVIVQKQVPILPEDTPYILADRVLQQEHIAYPEALDAVLKKMASPA
ncbi:MAG: phosphoribosylglycinamide formyltransferase [Alphaproteobacteria bacterium]|nr:phosphoribosylglycinamide formyltransferase [Alphaproteobacteria bacterium]